MPWGTFVAPSRRRKLDTLGYNVKEVAAALGVSVRTVYYALQAGKLQCHRFSAKTVRISLEQIKAWIGAGGELGRLQEVMRKLPARPPTEPPKT